MATSDRTWVEVSRRALLWNFGQFQHFFRNQALIAPVVKANAYGHGNRWVVENLHRSPIWGFCVAYDTEAEELRRFTAKPILVLSAWQETNLPRLIRHGIRLVVWDLVAARTVARVARRLGRRAIVHLKIDTGTTRIGTRLEALAGLKNFIRRQPALTVEGVFSHYADSEAASLTFTRQQQRRFVQAAHHIPAPYLHLACTAASLRLPLPPTNLVRLGLGLYGLWPSSATRQANRVSLKPVLSWKTRLLQVKSVPASTTIGYHRTYRLRRSSTIGVIPIGYADGYDRRASNRSSVVIADQLYPIIGRVCMNLTMIDLGARRRIQPGTEVTLLGPRVDADELARQWGTINYEVVSRIDREIPRLEVA
ncbi:MAG: alanine racemase [Candidatus Kerfeldbacteria bacterium]|nr:alanine racemase [Candidatus Kerfeldbacteria bacterium]